MSAFLAAWLPHLLTQAATLFACLVGGVLALTLTSAHRRVGLLLGAGCLLIALTVLGGSLVTAYLIAHASEAGGAAGIGPRLAAVGVATSLLHAGGVGLLIAAALADRHAGR